MFERTYVVINLIFLPLRKGKKISLADLLTNSWDIGQHFGTVDCLVDKWKFRTVYCLADYTHMEARFGPSWMCSWSFNNKLGQNLTRFTENQASWNTCWFLKNWHGGSDTIRRSISRSDIWKNALCSRLRQNVLGPLWGHLGSRGYLGYPCYPGSQGTPPKFFQILCTLKCYKGILGCLWSVPRHP